jgi:hypothetical protein
MQPVSRHLTTTAWTVEAGIASFAPIATGPSLCAVGQEQLNCSGTSLEALAKDAPVARRAMLAH